MAGSRKWITRDEIADIYDSMADKFEESIPVPESGRGGDQQDELDRLRAPAEGYRAIERLSNPIGNRVA